MTVALMELKGISSKHSQWNLHPQSRTVFSWHSEAKSIIQFKQQKLSCVMAVKWLSEKAHARAATHSTNLAEEKQEQRTALYKLGLNSM